MSNLIEILVREKSYDRLARVVGSKIRASCTSSAQTAAQNAAAKYFGGPPFTLTTVQRGDCVSGRPWKFTAQRCETVFTRE